MESTLEMSVIGLIINSSIFTKAILSLLLFISVVSWAIMIQKYFFINIYKSDISRFLKTVSNQSGLNLIEEACMHFSKGAAKNNLRFHYRIFSNLFKYLCIRQSLVEVRDVFDYNILLG